MSADAAAERVILHVDMDAFFASVEQRDHPEWKGRPVVVGAGPNERGVVAAASYEARKFGIHSAMPSREAGKRCPNAIFVPPDMEKYAAASREVFSILERFTPLVEPLSIDEAFLDVTGSVRLFGDGPAIAERIRDAIRRELMLTASVGVACNKFLAKLASDMNKPDGLTVVPTDPAGIREFLAQLPVFRIWGVGRVTGGELEKAGLRTVGDIQRIPAAGLSRLLGTTQARHLKLLADGVDDREVITDSEEKSISREHTFPEDCSDPQRLRRVMLDLVDDVGRSLRAAGKYAGLARVKLRWKGFETITRQRTLPEPVCDDFALRAVALDILGGIELVKPVRLVGFGVGRLSATPASQLSLFDNASAKPGKREKLSRTVDAIRRDLGEDSIRRWH